jgi:hypothetical protein
VASTKIEKRWTWIGIVAVLFLLVPFWRTWLINLGAWFETKLQPFLTGLIEPGVASGLSASIIALAVAFGSYYYFSVFKNGRKSVDSLLNKIRAEVQKAKNDGQLTSSSEQDVDMPERLSDEVAFAQES